MSCISVIALALLHTFYALAYEVPRLRDDVAVVFSWQVGNPDSDVRWGSRQVGNAGDMFKVAVKSIYETHPGMPIYLFSNGDLNDPEVRGMLTQVIDVDLMAAAGLDRLYAINGDDKLGFGTKPQAILTGWDMDILPEYVIYLDVDIAVSSASPRFNLYSIVEPLIKHYDMTGCLEGWGKYAVHGDIDLPYPSIGAGFEVNTGVFAIKRSARGLLVKWLEVFMGDFERMMFFLTGEQQALMRALEITSYRLFPLPPMYNFRRFTLTHLYNIGLNDPVPVVVRSTAFSSSSSSSSSNIDDAVIANYYEVAREAGILHMEGALSDFKRQLSSELHFDCSKLNAIKKADGANVPLDQHEESSSGGKNSQRKRKKRDKGKGTKRR